MRSPTRQRNRPYPPPELTPELAASKMVVRPVVTTLLPRELIADLDFHSISLSLCHPDIKKKEQSNVMTD